MDKIVVQCSCGKRYKAAADKVGKKMRCKACGEPFEIQPVEEDLPAPTDQEGAAEEAPAQAPAGEAPAAGAAAAGREAEAEGEDEYAPALADFRPPKRMKLDVDVPGVDPDSLMEEIAEPVIGRSLGISAVVHILLIVVTSVGFALQWRADAQEYGTWNLQAIAQKKEEARKEAERQAREAKAAELRAKEEAERKERLAEKQQQQQAAGEGQGENGEEASAYRENLEEKSFDFPEESGQSFGLDETLEEDEQALGGVE
jgi:hypothetical protein